VPDLEALQLSDAAFTTILESRRSRRAHGELEITARELGEFLYRSSRETMTMDVGAMEVGLRPYPTAAGMPSLELYPVVNACRDIAPGIHRYCPENHRLELISESNRLTHALLNEARLAVCEEDLPQVLIVFCARVEGIFGTHKSFAYSLLLKEVGALMQTIYLVATAMGLAPCAVGSGDWELFAAASATDPLLEPAIGEFILGRGGEGEGLDRIWRGDVDP
jgi:SagB-type dehydrogenase family enzyme